MESHEVETPHKVTELSHSQSEQNAASSKSHDALREALAAIDLAPEQTRDDQVNHGMQSHGDSDDEFLHNVPPHHG